MRDEIRIVHVNAEIRENSVPNRLRTALAKYGIRTSILTLKTNVTDADICVVERKFFDKVFRKIDYLLLNLEHHIRYTNDNGLPFSFYRIGVDISKSQIIKDADIIVLHWICGAFISAANLKQLVRMRKPIIIVCHDSWFFTGGCHVRLGCERFINQCGRCPQLNSDIMKDWSFRLLKAKIKAIRGAQVTVVSPSNWMDQNVGRSTLFKNFKHCVIPNPIDTDAFCINEKKKQNSQVFTLTFGAVNAVSTPYKGYHKLMETLDILEEEYLGDFQVQALIFGAKEGEERLNKKIKIKYLGYLSEMQMAELFNYSDIYVMPSLDDNLPGTVMECLACGTPVVAFNVGGIPDMICHKKNGYLAEYKNSKDLAHGIYWVMTHNENNVLGKFGREYIVNHFSERVVAQKYMELFKQLTN